ncbi:DUF1275 domain-containing protein [Aureimonas fodinaquatilis]|uniref:DUF1275 domain-containing protein n=1 Tax=Aureimonas fodinaquatilis TaxID=2565783 RepID=A0A5B0E1A9_9HYPH|nr:YoaK family protein [Aureimonas fodinaquatilis]KAA0971905.1 DUF1275 domain-containing protein [Aureimonas fodinaquatilis]
MQSAPVAVHPEITRYPLMEKPLTGFLLAVMAGSMNAWTLAHAQTFATVQSGNVVQSGYRLVQGDWEAFTFSSLSVLAFGIGSALCGALMTSMLHKGKVYTPVVLFGMFAALVALAFSARAGSLEPQYIAYGISFIAGAQGNAFHKDRGMLFGAVAVTFVVQMAFNFLVQSLYSRTGINGKSNLSWAGIFFLTLLGFAGGGAVGFLIDQRIAGAAIFLPAAIALVLGAMALANPEKADPTPGGLIG